MVSILDTIKTKLEINPEDTHFDEAVITEINSAIMVLTQLGVGPVDGFIVEDSTQTWEDFIGTRKDLVGVKTYIYLKAKLVIDPPQMGYLVELINKQITEYEWRLNHNAEGGTTDV